MKENNEINTNLSQNKDKNSANKNILQKSDEKSSKTINKKEYLKTLSNGDKDKIKNFLQEGADNNLRDAQGVTPIHYTAYWGFTDLVEILLNKGTDLDEKDFFGRTPLHCAAVNGHLETVKFLHSKGADIEAKENRGGNALHMPHPQAKLMWQSTSFKRVLMLTKETKIK